TTLFRTQGGLLRGQGGLLRGSATGQGEGRGLLLGGAVDRGAEIDRAAQLDGQVLDEHAGAEGHVRVDVVGERSAQVDRLQVGLDAVVTAHPVGVVLGLEAERHLQRQAEDRKSTRLNSSHVKISYAV